MPGVLLAALHTSMEVATVVTEPAPERAIEKGASASATVLERSDSFPLVCWDPSVSSDLAGVFGGTLLVALIEGLGIPEQDLLPLATSFVLPGLG